MKYVAFTTKHHTGFCMWDTKTTDFNVMHTPYANPIVIRITHAEPDEQASAKILKKRLDESRLYQRAK